MNSSTADYPVSDAVTTNQLDYVHESFYVLNGLIGSVICIIGILGNIFTIFIFSKMIKVNHSATTVFLLAMAVADLFVVVFYLLYGLLCLATPPVPLLSAHDFTIDQVGGFVYTYYYLWTYPTNTFVTISTWLTVSVMVFRFIAVYHPLKATRWCSMRRAKIVLITVNILSIIIYIPEWFVIKARSIPTHKIFYFAETSLIKDEAFHNIYFIGLIEVLNSLLPFTICLVLTVMLLWKLKGRNSELIQVNSSQVSFNKRRSKEQKRIGTMLLAVVTLFIVCTIPSLIWRGLKYRIGSQEETEDSFIIARSVADIFQVLNHAMNFIIYFLSNRKFYQIFRTTVLRQSESPITLQASISMTRQGSKVSDTFITKDRRPSSFNDMSTSNSLHLCKRTWRKISNAESTSEVVLEETSYTTDFNSGRTLLDNVEPE